MNEIIISNYDYRYCYSLAINGILINDERRYDIVREFDDTYEKDIPKFMEKYNCNRLIVCCDGGLEIYTR